MGGASKGIMNYYIYLRKAMCHKNAFMNFLQDFLDKCGTGDYLYSVE